MSDKLKLRASSLPMAFKCPGSVRRGPLCIDAANDAADMGSAAHEGHARMVERGSVDWDLVPELSWLRGVEERELRVLLAQGQKLWNQIRESFPNASTEVELVHEDEEFILTGHVDVLGSSGSEAHVGDWKDGRLDKDFAEQLMGYCALVLLTFRELERATAGIMWVRECEFEPYSMGRHLLAKWLERLRTEVVRWDGTFRPGAHCKHCHRDHECPARKALVRRDVEAFSDKMTVAVTEDVNALSAMPPESIVELLAKADRVRLYAERVRDAIREHVMQHGEVTGGGYKLMLQHDERRGLDTRAAWGVLESWLDDAEMPDVIELKISKVEDAVAKAAGKGKGAAAKRDLQKALEEAGAIKTSVTTKLVVRRAT